MYTFNNFEYETYAEALLPKVIAEKETYIKLIREIYDTYDKLDEKQRKVYEFIEEAIGYSTVGGLVTAIPVSLVMGNSIGETALIVLAITGASFVGQMGTTLINAAIYVRGRNKISDNTYKTIVYGLNETIKNGSTLTIEQIHETRKSLLEGEFSDKYDYIAEEGKLGIDLLVIDDENNRLYEDVDDPTVLRVYEILCRIIMMGYEGYEKDVLMAYDAIKGYVHDKTSGKFEHTALDKYHEVFSYLENQLHKNLKSK